MKIGDRVQLVAGGPAMVIAETGYAEGRWIVCWLDKEEKMQQANLPEAALEPSGSSDVRLYRVLRLIDEVAESNGGTVLHTLRKVAHGLANERT